VSALIERTNATTEPEHVTGIGACWEWHGYRDPKGYGQVWHGGRMRRAHRASWEEANGPISDGPCVLHKCDNRACVRPDHLFLGTVAENNADMKTKGRGNHPRGDRNGARAKPEMLARGDRNGSRTRPERRPRPRGEVNGRAKLTEENVREIRSRSAAGESQRALGRAFGVSHQAVDKIVQRRAWAHLDAALRARGAK
jgi:HNH endonuclease